MSNDMDLGDMTLENNRYDILIIDDSVYIRKLLIKILKIKGYNCRCVDNTSKALDELEYHIPQLILLDVHLPDSNGYNFCLRLKSDERFNKILVYYFTGVSEAEVAIKTLETKADGYLTKPFDLSDFYNILEHLEQTVAN